MHEGLPLINTIVTTTVRLTYSMANGVGTGLSLTSSIVWNDCKEILNTGTWIVWSEGVTCIYNICAVSAIITNGCWACLIIHIVLVNEDSVPNIRIHVSDIQREGSSPRDKDLVTAIDGCQTSYRFQFSCT